MSTLNIAPIVEGHGDEAAIRLLLSRIWVELLSQTHANVLKPIRSHRDKLLKAETQDLERAIGLAVYKLEQCGGGLILILIDAEEDCARIGSIGPLLLRRALGIRPDKEIAVVIANVMYETWFVAAATSLSRYLHLPADFTNPVDAEGQALGKGWIKQRMQSGKYSETADQAALTSVLDLAMCRGASKSFDKLCRVLEAKASRNAAGGRAE